MRSDPETPILSRPLQHNESVGLRPFQILVLTEEEILATLEEENILAGLMSPPNFAGLNCDESQPNNREYSQGFYW